MGGGATFSYDVFLSFRGEDTRRGFTGNLYHALHQRGIRTFFDDKELPKGEELTPALVKAIGESRIAITVLSKNYAFSSFCLEELATILRCVEENKVRVILPVFYCVDPSDVRHLRKSYGEALATHEDKFKEDKEKFNDNKEKIKFNQKISKWKNALHKAANLGGFTYNHGYPTSPIFYLLLLFIFLLF
ncbi:hypothetical protein VNO77_39251 [Canavalia gladiata]|uniref:TIR domain-containing protein n=1 Tax=Canavalia gladiata TaxID=3824 RepID=A0AAN9PZL3_CANGL